MTNNQITLENPIATIKHWRNMIDIIKRPIIIIFTGHVGSSWLTSLLGSHESIEQLGFEPIDDFVIDNIDSAPIVEGIVKGTDITQFPGHISKILSKTYEKAPEDEIYNVCHNNNLSVASFVVFKTRVYLEEQASLFIELLPKINPVVLLLCRKNKIKNAISQFKRTQLDISHLGNFSETNSKRAPVHVDPSYIYAQAVNFVRRELIAKTYFDNLTSLTSAPNYEIFYEDLLSVDWRTEFLCKFFHKLGLVNSPTATNYLKITPNDIKDAVKNVDELYDKFCGTPFQSYIHNDDYNLVDEIYRNKIHFPGINAQLIREEVKAMFTHIYPEREIG